MRGLVAFVAGLLFAVGLGISGMTDPAKVIGFLDVTGDWDPSLALVMVGAISVSAIGWAIRRWKGRSWLSADPLPCKQGIDVRLLLGAGIFGVGWGLAGYCPGPAVVSVGAGALPALAFFGGMLGGMVLEQTIMGEAPKAVAEKRVG